MTTRRDFLKAAGLAAGAAVLPSVAETAAAAGTIERAFGPRMKLSLAAYSFRVQDSLPGSFGDHVDETKQILVGIPETHPSADTGFKIRC